MRVASFFILCVFALASHGQLTIKPIIKSQRNQRGRVSATQTINRATLPFWDDFSITQDSPDSIRVWGNDTTAQWNYDLSKDVFVNATLAINPPSYGVATFDGLDVNGAFHGGDKGLADQLVSDTIDIQGKVNVILSFYWQAAGNVEIPDAGDSLVLQFYTPSDTINPWKTVWNVDGAELAPDQDTVFTQETIQVPSQFLTQRFQFRFQSYGDLDGPFDAWHIDWIYLNENRGSDDFFYEDVSINSEVSLIFSPYRSIPIDQYRQQSIDPLVTATSMNLNPEPDRVGPSTFYNLKIIEKRIDQEIVIDSAFNPDLRTFFNPDPSKISLVNELEFGAQDISNITGSDSVIIETEISMDTTDFRFLDGTQINLRVNDTVRTQNLLSNYYAYDDGTAEYAVGTNINGAQVAIEFWLEQEDTLTHVDIHFPNIDPPSANSALQLQVFKSLDAEPIRSQSINVINGSEINQFARYKLASPLIISDTFYIGYLQSKNEYIGIGFDRSNPAASEYIFENKTGQWEQNTRLIGALMMRPIFERIDSLVLGNAKQLVSKVYPNPTNGVLHIEGDYQSISLRDFSGRTILHQIKLPAHDLSNLKSGLYLLTIHRKEGDQTLKIIKQ